jgi:putative tryptophan/tyrosine transport system substrate-binding protein
MQFGQLKRRDFITLFGSAAVMSVAAHAQATMPVVGFLHGAVPEGYVPAMAAFRKGLSEVGYSEGHNVAIELRWAEGRLERLPQLAADLVRHQPSVIFAGGGPEPALAAKAATSKIPIVFANGVDPVEVGLVASLSRPGGNITGVTFLINTLGPKELEALHSLRPEANVIAALINPDLATTASQSKDLEMAARALGLQAHVLNASTEREIETVFASLPQMQAGGLVIGANAFFFSRRDQLVGLAQRYSVPTVYPWREAVVAGGLMSYGANVADAYRIAGSYTGRILGGEKPADLPVQQSTNTELVINLKTAKSLGLTFPITLLGRANEVIE